MPTENTETVSEIERREGLQVPVGEETVSATRFRPVDADGPLPALLMYFPYRKDDHLVYGAYAPIVEYLAAHGYEVVTADMVGTGASTGRKRDTGNVEDEGAEAAAIIDWLADREWCTGRVGMFGKSYGGNNCLAAAVQGPDALEAIVPIMAGISSYEEVGYVGGVFTPFERAGHWNSQMLALQSLPSSYRDDDGRWAEAWKDHLAELREGRPWLFTTMDHDARDDYWEPKELPVEEVDVPTFGVSGWRDYFPSPTLEFVRRIDAPSRFLLGPWRHAMPHRARETTIDFRPQVVEWFDRFLKDRENGARDRPRVAFWTERDGGGRVEGGTWRGAESWPPTDGELSYALSPDGLVPSGEFDAGDVAVEYEHDHTVGMYSPDDRPFAVPADVGPDDARSLCFETDPFEEAVELTGAPTATVRLRSTVADPTLVVRLTNVAPDGTARLVSHGRLRASHRRGHDDPEALTPGEEYEVTVPMKPKSHVFERGHRMRVAISAAFFPLALPTTSEQGAYTVLSTPAEPSAVTFPGRVHEGDVAFDDGVEMGRPDDRHVPTASPYPTEKRGAWETARDHLTGEATVRTVMAHAIDLPHGGSMAFDQEIEAVAAPDDPASYVVRSETEVTVDYGTEEARAVVGCRVAPESAQLSTSVTFDGQPVFEETWMR